jgi:hypothetical protein
MFSSSYWIKSKVYSSDYKFDLICNSSGYKLHVIHIHSSNYKFYLIHFPVIYKLHIICILVIL